MPLEFISAMPLILIFSIIIIIWIRTSTSISHSVKNSFRSLSLISINLPLIILHLLLPPLLLKPPIVNQIKTFFRRMLRRVTNHTLYPILPIPPINQYLLLPLPHLLGIHPLLNLIDPRQPPSLILHKPILPLRQIIVNIQRLLLLILLYNRPRLLIRAHIQLFQPDIPTPLNHIQVLLARLNCLLGFIVALFNRVTQHLQSLLLQLPQLIQC